MNDRRNLDRVRDFLAPDEATTPVRRGAPSQVGKYTLIREIGRGGMGVVYEAEDPKLKRRVALKLLKEGEENSKLVARLHREAAIAAQLRHPNIVGIHEVGMDQDEGGRNVHFIAMDLVQGRTMTEMMEGGRTPLPELLRILEDVARAAGYAHSQGVVHRDIKPANILVEPGGRVLLTDFGLAHADSFHTRLTRTNAVMGTPQYMAPEQVEGRTQEMGPRTDVYALGVILYELLAGRPPFLSDTPAQLYQMILQDEPTRPSRMNRAADRELEVVCYKAIDKDPSRRYADGSGFADDLSRFRRGEPIQARPPSVMYRIRKEFRRRRVLIGAAAAVVAITLGALASDRAMRSHRLEALLAQARQLETDGRASEARDAYQNALGIDAGDARAREGAARMKEVVERRERDHGEALRLLEEGRPALDKAAQYLYRADANYEDLVRQVEAGRSAVERAVALAPDLALGHFLLGQAWSITGWDDRAERSWREAIRLDPAFGRAHLQLGRLLMTRAFLATLVTTATAPSAAGKRYDEARDPAEEAAREIDEALKQALTLDSDLQRGIATAMRFYTQQRSAELRDAAEEGLRRFGSEDGVEELWWLKGLALTGTAERRQAFEAALKKRPHYALALFSLSVELQKGDAAAAIDMLARALVLNPRFEVALINRGSLLMNAGRLEEADTDLTKAIGLNPGRSLAWATRGDVRAKGGDFEAALGDFDRAIGVNPDIASYYASRGLVHQHRKEPELAIADYSAALDRDPGFMQAWLQRGNLRHDRGEFAAAVSDFDKAIALKDDVPAAWSHRGRSLLKLGRPADAARDLRKALELAPASWPQRPEAERLLEDAERAAREH